MCLKGVIEGMSLGHIRSLKIVRSQLTHTFGERVVVQSVMSNSFQPHEWQHARFPCPSPSPGACSNSCPLSGWCHPTISSSVIPFSSYLQSFPASGSFPMSQFFASGGQSTGVSDLVSFLSKKNPRADLLQNGLVGSPCSPRDSQESSPTPQFKSINSSHQVARILELQFQHQPFQWIFRVDLL